MPIIACTSVILEDERNYQWWFEVSSLFGGFNLSCSTQKVWELESPATQGSDQIGGTAA